MIVTKNLSPEHVRERRIERIEMLEDIRVAEEQIARGEGIEHEEAKRQILARFKRFFTRSSRHRLGLM